MPGPTRSPVRSACLRETCPDEPSAAVALGRLLKEAEGHQSPERDATFGRVLDIYLEVTDSPVHPGTTRATSGGSSARSSAKSRPARSAPIA